MRASGFEPNYSYYYTNNQIIVNVEAPGNCNLESSIQWNGEYIIIKINGNKIKDEHSAINNGREFGEFSLDIPLKYNDLIINQKELLIKNQKPIIYKKDGIFIIIYQLEENNLANIFTK